MGAKMKIELSEKNYVFLKDFMHKVRTQDNRATARPYFYVVRSIQEIAVPSETADEHKYFYHEMAESFTQDELIKYCKENNLDFDDVKDNHCSRYGLGTKEVEENVFFTEEGYKQHMELNGHNYRHLKETFSYVKYANRNPEIKGLFEALEEIIPQLKRKIKNES